MYSGYEPKFLTIAPALIMSLVAKYNFLSLIWPSQSIKKSCEFIFPRDGLVSILDRFMSRFSNGFRTDINDPGLFGV